MTEHIETRSKIKEIPKISTFNELLNSCTISEEEKELMRRHYIENQTFCFIGNELGYTEVTMKRWHKRILKKLNKLL